MEKENIENKMETLIFLSKEPITVEELAKFYSLSLDETKEILSILKEKRKESGINIRIENGAVFLVSNPLYGEDVKKFLIKPLNKKWGFCNYEKKYVALNVELIKRTPFEIEYVILHELAHLKYPNHGKGFYNYVEKYMPNYRNAEKMLNAKHHY